jgi:hypothetical protein
VVAVSLRVCPSDEYGQGLMLTVRSKLGGRYSNVVGLKPPDPCKKSPGDCCPCPSQIMVLSKLLTALMGREKAEVRDTRK